ncbi:MAG: BglG family transcription antiterminator [Coprobacillaceae bacterium]
MGIIYSLDARCQKILQMIMNTQGYLTISEIAEENRVSKRSVYYDIMKINEWLDSFHIDPIEIERNKGVFVKQTQIKEVKQILHEAIHNIEYLFTPTQRIQIIICSILTKTRELYIEDFIMHCKVSRNTVINDLKIVDRELQKYGLEISYENKVGYRIVGDFTKKVSVFFLYFNDLSEYYRKGAIPLENRERIYQIDEKLNRIEQALETKYVSGVLFALATFMSSIGSRSGKVHFSKKDIEDIMKTKEYTLVNQYFNELQQDHQLYIALHLLGSRLQTIPIDMMIDSEGYTYELATSLVREFSKVACIEFSNEEQVINALFAHLKTSLYRYRYGIQLTNPMLQDIKHEYNELFEITIKACQVLQRELGVPIPDSEIAYITLHFGGFMVDNNGNPASIKILIICPNGVSTGNMLKAEISNLVPQATTIDTIMLSQFDSNHDYDVVISTVEMKKETDILVIHPILTDSDRVMVLRRCMKYSNENKVRVEEIVDIAKNYMSKKDIKLFKKGLENYFTSNSKVHNSPKQSFGFGMLNHLYEENILICNTDYNWQEAIIFASVPLLDNNSIEERYVESIVKKCNEMGPYMFITNNVVLAHAGIKDGVHRLGFSLAKFNTPIHFNEHRKADIIMVLATSDQVSHIRILHDIMAIFSEPKNIDCLLKRNSSKGILQEIENILNKEKEST